MVSEDVVLHMWTEKGLECEFCVTPLRTKKFQLKFVNWTIQNQKQKSFPRDTCIHFQDFCFIGHFNDVMHFLYAWGVQHQRKKGKYYWCYYFFQFYETYKINLSLWCIRNSEICIHKRHKRSIFTKVKKGTVYIYIFLK